MRGALGRPLVVLVLALTLLGGMATVASIPPSTSPDDPSSRSPGRDGTLALHTWLGDLGFQVHRIGSEFDLSGTDVVISVAPRSDFRAEEVDTMMRHLAGGGDVVIALNGAGGTPAIQGLLDRFHIEVSDQADPGVAVPAQPIDAGGRVERVRVGPSAVLDGPPEVVPLLRAGGRVIGVAVRVAHGGRAYLFGSSTPFSNEGLRHDDASGLVLTLLERARGGRIALDEFHHGEGNAQTGAAAILLGPVGLAMLLGGALALALLAVGGRRVGRPRPARDPARAPSAATYMGAMAALYRRSSRRGGVADRYAEELKSRIARVSGVDAHLGDDSFLAALFAYGGDGPLRGAAELLARARMLAASNPSEVELLWLARDIDAAERRWAQPV